MDPTMPAGYALVVNVIIGGLIKGLIEFSETRLPTIPNSIIVSVCTAAGLALSWATSLLIAPGLSFEVIATATFAGVGIGSVLNSAANKPLAVKLDKPEPPVEP